MNYLAHLHIASQSNSSPLGNLLGDFVRGDPTKQSLSIEIVHGIILHRWVDSFTDESPIVAEAKSFFPKNCRRFSPIALDIFWDHMLAKHWSSFSEQNLEQFCGCMRYQCHTEELVTSVLPPDYLRVSNMMWTENWIPSYQHWEKTQFAIERLSEKKNCYAPLALCNETLDACYLTLEDLFEPFYLQLLNESISYVRSNFPQS